VVGVDLVAVSGLSAATLQTIISEVGTDRSKFPTVKHFGSWLGLAPHNDISGGKVLRSRTRKVVNRAAQAFRQAAQSVARSDRAFGAYLRRMRARLGPQQAIVATGYKIAGTVYTMLKEHRAFQNIGAAEYEQRYREREVQYPQRKAAKLGFDLTPKPAMEPAPSYGFLSNHPSDAPYVGTEGTPWGVPEQRACWAAIRWYCLNRSSGGPPECFEEYRCGL